MPAISESYETFSSHMEGCYRRARVLGKLKNTALDAETRREWGAKYFVDEVLGSRENISFAGLEEMADVFADANFASSRLTARELAERIFKYVKKHREGLSFNYSNGDGEMGHLVFNISPTRQVGKPDEQIYSVEKRPGSKVNH